MKRKIKKILALMSAFNILNIYSANFITFAEDSEPVSQDTIIIDEKEDTYYPESPTAVISDNSLIVSIKTEYSNIENTIDTDYFDELSLESVDNLFVINDIENAEYFDEQYYRHILKLNFSDSGMDTLNQAVSILESRDDVRAISYDYYDSQEDIDIIVDSDEIDPDEGISAMSDLSINDRFYESYQKNTYFSAMNMEDAWSITMGSKDIKVGVIDSGIDVTQADLADNIWVNPGEIAGNGIDDDGNGYIDDVYGWNCQDNNNNIADSGFHGTAVASVIGAVTNNEIGIAGICPNVSLIPLKVSGNSSQITAIEYAINNDIPILNYSRGGSINDTVFKDAIQTYKGLFICSAGNDGKDLDDDANNVYPVKFGLGNVISVASINRYTQALYTTFNYGGNTVDTAACGVNVYTCCPNNAFLIKSGTSYSAPIVAGIAALCKSYYPEATTEQIKTAILTSVVSNESLQGKVRSGGYVNAYNALLKMQDYLPIQDGTYYIVNNSSGKCLEKTSDNKIIQNDQNSLSSLQKWKFEYQNNGYYVIKSAANTNLRMDVNNAWDTEGNTISVYVDTGYAQAQSFRVTKTTDGNVQISPKLTKTRCLQIDNTDGTNLILKTNTGIASQQWVLRDVNHISANKTYYIKNQATGKYLKGSSVDNSISLGSFEKSSLNQWKLVYNSNGYYQIKWAYNNNYYINYDTEFQTSAPGQPKAVSLMNYSNQTNEKYWKFKINYDGSYSIILKYNPSYCFYGSASSNSSYFCAQMSNNAYSSWVLEEVDSVVDKEVYIVNKANNKYIHESVGKIDLIDYAAEQRTLKWTMTYSGNDTYQIHKGQNSYDPFYISGYDFNEYLQGVRPSGQQPIYYTWTVKMLDDGSYKIMNTNTPSKGFMLNNASDTNIKYGTFPNDIYINDLHKWSIIPA